MKGRFYWIALMAALLLSAFFVSGCAGEESGADLTMVTSAPTETPIVTATPEATATPEETATPVPTATPVINPFNGGVLASEDDFAPFAVVIENTGAARPQSGIGQADIVYEVYMETGGVTRLIALFSNALPEKVGPVRSGRIHHVHVLSQFPGIALVHFGGSEPAGYDFYAEIKKIDVGWRSDGVNGPNSGLFWRDDSREAPHNAYASLVRDKEEAGDFYDGGYYQVLHFDEALKAQTAEVAYYELNYYGSYQVTYEYVPEVGGYRRWASDELMTDENTGEPIVLQNVVVIHTKYTYGGPANYANFTSTGSGEAEFLINGVYRTGTWSREDYHSPYVFQDDAGEEIAFCPGHTWVDITYSDDKHNLTPTDSAP